MALNPAVSLHLPCLAMGVLLDYLGLQKAVELFDDSTTEKLTRAYLDTQPVHGQNPLYRLHVLSYSHT